MGGAVTSATTAPTASAATAVTPATAATTTASAWTPSTSPTSKPARHCSSACGPAQRCLRDRLVMGSLAAPASARWCQGVPLSVCV